MTALHRWRGRVGRRQAVPNAAGRPMSPVRLTMRRMVRQPGAWLGALLAGAALLAALIGPWIAPYPPNELDLAGQLQPPSALHPAGTDFYGRDLASRLLYGARATLATAALAVAIGLTGGTVLGLLAGYSRAWFGHVFVGVIDLMLAFPALLLALLVVALLGPGLVTLGVAVGIAGIPVYARLVRSAVLTVRSSLYVEAAHALGANTTRILFRHLLPAVLPPILAWTALDTGWAILTVAGLGFLGLGAPPPQAEWGLMLFEGREYLAVAPWTSIVPGLAITLTVLGMTLLGDALNDALRPNAAHK
jgi:peptide/nickel transport system permease protein